jgi:hypothetical protein
VQRVAQDDAAIAIAGVHGGWGAVRDAARAAYETRLKRDMEALRGDAADNAEARAALWARYQTQYERLAPPALRDAKTGGAR